MKKQFIVGLVVSVLSLAGAPLLAAAPPDAQAKSPATATAAARKTTARKKKMTTKKKKTQNAAHVKKGKATAPAPGASKS
jgi:hypothetical protein